jgi:ribonuclease HI
MAAQPVWSTAPCQEEIAVEAPLGRGGYGAVYRGYWRHKTPAAIKVMHTHNNEQEVRAAGWRVGAPDSATH